MAVANTGSARLKNVQLSGPYGPPCAAIATLLPAANITTCVVKLSVNQADFDAHELNPANVLSLGVTATGTSNVSTALVIPSPAATFTGLRLPIDRSMEVTASLRAGVINQTGDAVSHTVVVLNNGNSKLRGVAVTTTLSTAGPTAAGSLGAYSCKLDGAGAGAAPPLDLPAGSNLSCTASYSFNAIARIEAGDLTFACSVGATDYGSTISLPDKVVQVPRRPQFTVTVNEQACGSAQPVPNSAGE